ncbi:MAG: D-alanine--D-alanine ligase B [Syntrophaceae bacterium PtaB.Bin095]|jgi:D-alanine-D-alanine ligase|nr:MAG: D-alanine--D-alanine ligase B [Syntrophaceae bacterium PtaB.Bin095]
MKELPVLLLHNLDPAWPSSDRETARREAECLASALGGLGHPVETVAVSHADLAACLKGFDPAAWVVLNWCEELPGIPHSDALVAEVLEDLGFTYTGATSDVLRLSWEKASVKRLLDAQGLPTPAWRIFDRADPGDWSCYPAIVKPAQEHCSLGVSTEAVVLNREELRTRIAFILDAFKQPALVEDFIDGREFHVSLWGNDPVQMLPPAEMDFSRFGNVRDRLCTYDAKFLPGSLHYEEIELRLPAPLTEPESDLLMSTLRAAFHAHRCRDFARMDVRLRDGIFYILDINPNADISSDASMACAAEAAGYSFGAMGSRLVHLAAARHPVFGRG